MNKPIDPYDLGRINVAEYCQKVDINNLVRQTKVELKGKILESEISALGKKVCLTTSQTRFGGTRLWFLCPVCSRRVGVIYKHPTTSAIGCRSCLELKYKKQRYKGMMEAI